MNAPALYLQNMQKMLGDEFDAYVTSFSMPAYHGLRVNTLRCNALERVRELPFVKEQIPYVDHGFFTGVDDKPSAHPYYSAGLYYLQEPSAMLPAFHLPVKPGELVLDLCAAPGGKATELLSKLKGEGILVANDISASRAQALLKNLEMTGGSNYFVCAESPDHLADVYGDVFDKILIDAPCSGEGMFRRDPAMIAAWNERGPSYYAAIQKEILESAYRLLKPGGMMLYSTCTFSVTEDEEQIFSLLRSHPDMHPALLKGTDGLCGGFLGLKEALRAFPHKIRGEGHFLCLLQKDPFDAKSPALQQTMTSDLKGKLPDELLSFLKKIKGSPDPQRIVVKGDQAYLLPLGYEAVYRRPIRYLRTGLLLGKLNRGHFKPDQALAMSLGAGDFDNVLDLQPEDDRVMRYLRGETLPLDASDHVENGDVLICIDGYPLGFAKIGPGGIKNLLRPSFRRM